MPDDAAVTISLSLPLDVHADESGLLHLVQSLPWLVRAEAADSYEPWPSELE